MKRPCMEAGCPRLVEKASRCPEHTRLHEQRDQQRRGTAAQRGYDREWQVARNAYAKAHPWCERHLRRGVRRRTQIVDHRRPLKQGGARLDPANFQALCASCHGFKSHQDGSVTKHGAAEPAPPQRDPGPPRLYFA